jgi:hypothetical protein
MATAMALALIAFVGASSASAAAFEIPGAGSESSTTWNGVRTGKAHVLQLGAGEETFSCENVSFSGQMKGESTTELTVSPELGNCTWFGKYPVVWAMNGCKFRLNTGPGTLDIVGCEKAMTFTTPGCAVEIGNQNGIGSVTFKSSEVEGLKTVTAAASLSGITYTRTQASACGGSSKIGTFSNGTYNGEWTVKPAHFATEATPAEILAKGNAKMFKFHGGLALSCPHFEATGFVGPVNSESITLNSVKFGSECISMGVWVTPSMGSCSLRYTASGDFQIVGPSCASNPITIIGTVGAGTCTITIGPTGLKSAFGYTPEGAGSSRSLFVSSGEATGITHTFSGAGCNSQGTFSDGIKPTQNLKISATKGFGSPNGLWIE